MAGENRESIGGGGAGAGEDQLGGLVLDPSNELKFRGPFDDYVSVSLSIRNPTDKRIAFKIKTTAPKRYCVKPNSGVLDPEQSIRVNVLLQPFVYDPNEKNKHKFMVQYMYLNDQEMKLNVNDILTMWKDVDAKRLHDVKLKCIFELTESDQQRIQQQQQQTTPAVDTIKSTNDSTMSASTAAAAAAAAIKSSTKSASNVSSSSFSKDTFVQAASDFDSSYVPTKQSTTTVGSATTNAATAATPAAAPAVSSRVDKNDNTLNELKLLRQENESLKKDIIRLKEEEARLRKLALQAPSSGLHKAQPTDALTELLNNRSTLIIIVLLAIVVYLLLFR